MQNVLPQFTATEARAADVFLKSPPARIIRKTFKITNSLDIDKLKLFRVIDSIIYNKRVFRTTFLHLIL